MKVTAGLGLPEYGFNTRHNILIIGAGLAGCAIANALAKRGYQCTVYDQHNKEAEATSALPAAVVRPAINGDPVFRDYFAYAFKRCCESIDGSLFTQCGSLELLSANRTASSLNRGRSDSENTVTYSAALVSAKAASDLAGTTLHSDALHIPQAGFIKPPEVCRYWLQHESINFIAATEVTALRKTQYGWQLLSKVGGAIDESQVVILATANQTKLFDVAADLPLVSAAGQIDYFEQAAKPLRCIVNGVGYLLPQTPGVWCGATHHLLDDQQRPEVSDINTSQNRKTAADIAPELSLLETQKSFTAVRSFTPDRLPVLGALHDAAAYRDDYADLRHGKPAHHYPPPRFHEGLYVATGLGSRGATQCLLIGELIADIIAPDRNAVSVQSQAFLQALHPGRFTLRSLRRGL